MNFSHNISLQCKKPYITPRTSICGELNGVTNMLLKSPSELDWVNGGNTELGDQEKEDFSKYRGNYTQFYESNYSREW